MEENLENTIAGIKEPEPTEMEITSTKTTSSAGSAHIRYANTQLAGTSKTLKRCLSVPIIHTPLHSAGAAAATALAKQYAGTMTTRSAAAAAMAKSSITCLGGININAIASSNATAENTHENPKKYFQNQQYNLAPDSSTGTVSSSVHTGINRSNPCSREVSPAPVFNIFAPRARRYSASYSPAFSSSATGGPCSATTSGSGTPLCLTPRVSQLRQEECVDMNSREVNHEREVHSAMQISQSWEDLTLVAENWSCKSDEFSNPLQVVLPSAGISNCSSPSPTSNRTALRLPYGLSPSPTRRTFATRRSMSPIAMRPSSLGPVKRKFELDDNNSGNWNVYSPPPLKKIFTESRGSSPICQSPSSVCPSPDSGTYDGRITPKLFISKLCTNNNSSACSSPMSASPSSCINGVMVDAAATSSSSSSSNASSVSGGSEPMCIGSNGVDEGISVSDNCEKQQNSLNINTATGMTTMRIASTTSVQPMSTDIQDESTLMDDIKSETSSIGGCSSISIESSSCDSGAKAAANFLNKFTIDDANMTTPTSTTTTSSPLGQKNFFINKQGISGAKKFIVNHDNNLTHVSSNETIDSIKVSSTSGAIMVKDEEDAVADVNAQVEDADVSMDLATKVATAKSVIVENKI